MQLFKRMGYVYNCVVMWDHHSTNSFRPRVILVEDHGVLVGLVTVKDVLRFIATQKPDHGPSWGERGGLDGLLEEAWIWASDAVIRTVSWSKRLLRR
jgi:chloride channel 3/4/5